MPPDLNLDEALSMDVICHINTHTCPHDTSERIAIKLHPHAVLYTSINYLQYSERSEGEHML